MTRYLEEARPKLALAPDDGRVFLTNAGLAFKPNRLTQMVRDYVAAASVGKTGVGHLFRHTCATLMVEGGADIRFIQQLLATRNWRPRKSTRRSPSACSRKSTPARIRRA